MDGRPCPARFARDQRLQEGSDSRAGRIAIAALLQRPDVTNDTEDDIGGRRNALFSDEELQLAGVRRPKTGEQTLCRDGVADEVDVAIEMEAEGLGANSSHRHNRGDVALFASTHRRHRGAIDAAIRPRQASRR